jgi:hypothetical protein
MVEWKPVTRDFAVELFNKTSTLVNRVFETERKTKEEIEKPRLLDFDTQQHDRREVLERTSEILSVVMGVTLVIVGTPPPATQNNP